MQTNLAPEYQNTPEGLEAEAILRKCVHCGFCTATCPTNCWVTSSTARVAVSI
jgi:glycolate oxidase iron-sulfur subunit